MSLSDFSTLAEAQADFVLGRVNKNDFANHDATHDVELILDDTLALTIPAELRKVVRVFRKIINGLLDNPNVGDDITQAALTALVATPDSICAYTQVMRDHLEDLSKTYPHATATQADFAKAKGLMVYTSAIQQISGFIKLNVSADCEAHRPQIFAVVQGINTQVGTAPEISKTGSYLARVPTNHSSYIVGNYYGVIS